MGIQIELTDDQLLRLNKIMNYVNSKGGALYTREEAVKYVVEFMDERIEQAEKNGEKNELELIRDKAAQLRDKLRPILRKQIQELVQQHFPNAIGVNYSTSEEYNDQDDEYYASILSVHDIDGNLDVFNVGWWSEHPANENRPTHEIDDIYTKGETLINELEANISYNDFLFAFGKEAYIEFD